MDRAAERHRALIAGLYAAFDARDGAAMAACYHPEARFSDPVFPDLRGPEIGRMWTMLCRRGKDLHVTLVSAAADAERGRARWEARYTFSGTGRPVHNLVDADLEFRAGLIARHVDRFDFHRWAGQALGLPGTLLGWSGFLRERVRRTAAEGLARFER